MTGSIERWIANLLRGGMLAALATMCAGGLWHLSTHGAESADHRTFRAISAFAADGRALMQLGIVILVATPVARVALSVGAFTHTRDRVYVAITAIVLCTLLYSLLGGH